MAKTIAEINEKIRKGKAVVMTAEEVIDIARQKGVRKAAEKIDVVTTGTFGPMCSSGAFLNFGHSKPRIKLGGGKVYLNDVPVYTGIAAADVFIGVNALPDDDPRNKFYPGEFNYGGTGAGGGQRHKAYRRCLRNRLLPEKEAGDPDQYQGHK
jgi:uncharacterized protein (DUF39 family)